MNIVKVKSKYQVTLPVKIRKQAGIEIGDILEAKVEKGKITLVPKSAIDKRLAEALADIKAGRTYGPFETVEEMIESLHRNSKKLRRRKR